MAVTLLPISMMAHKKESSHSVFIIKPSSYEDILLYRCFFLFVCRGHLPFEFESCKNSNMNKMQLKILLSSADSGCKNDHHYYLAVNDVEH